MGQIAFPMNDDGLVWDFECWFKSQGGDLKEAVNNHGMPIVHVAFPDAQDIAADIMRRKIAHTYRKELAA